MNYENFNVFTPSTTNQNRLQRELSSYGHVNEASTNHSKHLVIHSNFVQTEITVFHKRKYRMTVSNMEENGDDLDQN